MLLAHNYQMSPGLPNRLLSSGIKVTVEPRILSEVKRVSQEISLQDRLCPLQQKISQRPQAGPGSRFSFPVLHAYCCFSSSDANCDGYSALDVIVFSLIILYSFLA